MSPFLYTPPKSQWIFLFDFKRLIDDEKLVDLAKKIKSKLQDLGLGRIIFENTGNIGKSYRKHDEIGTPLCITVDFETLESNTVTVRDRDSMQQERVDIKEINSFFVEKIT